MRLYLENKQTIVAAPSSSLIIFKKPMNKPLKISFISVAYSSNETWSSISAYLSRGDGFTVFLGNSVCVNDGITHSTIIDEINKFWEDDWELNVRATVDAQPVNVMILVGYDVLG